MEGVSSRLGSQARRGRVSHRYLDQAGPGSVSEMGKEKAQARHGDHAGQHAAKELRAWARRSEMGRGEQSLLPCRTVVT